MDTMNVVVVNELLDQARSLARPSEWSRDRSIVHTLAPACRRMMAAP